MKIWTINHKKKEVALCRGYSQMGQTTFQALKKRIEDYFDNKDSVSHYLRSNENNLNSYSIQVFNDSLNNVLKTITENGDVGTFADDKMEKLCEGFAEFEEPDLKTKFDNLLNLCHSLSSEISKAKLDLSERKNKDSEKEKKELKEKLEKEFEEKLESKKKELEEKLEKEKKEFEENLEKEKKELEEKNKKLEEKLEEKEKGKYINIQIFFKLMILYFFRHEACKIWV